MVSAFKTLLQETHGVSSNLGALMLGSLISTFFSGAVTMQVILYWKTYGNDTLRLKLIVAGIWIIDILHTSMVMASSWIYLIDNFGDPAIHDVIPWTVIITVLLTAIITFFVHCFFAHRIYTLSKKNLYITVPIVVLAFARMVSALSTFPSLWFSVFAHFGHRAVTSGQWFRLGRFSKFGADFQYLVTLGLSLAVGVDVLIAVIICWYLNRRRTGFSGYAWFNILAAPRLWFTSIPHSMDSIIDSITLYTIENGVLTCVATTVSLVAWITMPHNLIFLSMHFAICKLYANALLATLNARKTLRGRSQGSTDVSDHPMPVLFPDSYNSRTSRNPFSVSFTPLTTSPPSHICFLLDSQDATPTQSRQKSVFNFTQLCTEIRKASLTDHLLICFLSRLLCGVVSSYRSRSMSKKRSSEMLM
ncbi:hypothetical protein NLI96_g6924 [Meripilus lineatus]|uniref:DUF6534 domain-containing protein n=1 Tax=Meripilus lineatus TaxID=2056292 RepID=A0AAD5V054_9APHY|nr:hypothetical protein NLI96_g6924 [Physisporinus lineatus]